MCRQSLGEQKCLKPVQVDFCEDKLVDPDLFDTLSDKTAGERNGSIVSTFYDVVRGTLKRRHKQRLTMNQVTIYSNS